MPGASSKVPLMIGLAGLVMSVSVVVLLRAEPVSEVAMPASSAPATVQPASVDPNSVAVPASEPVPTIASTPTVRAKPRPRSRMARDLERERIWSALARKHQLQPAAPGSAAPTPEAAKALPSLDPAYIKSAISEQLQPVMRECYESAPADDAKLAGTLIAEFTIVGAEDVGCVVEEATISDDSTLESPFMRECVRESALAVTFDPPSDGGRLQVSFRFEFAPDAE